MFKKMICMLLCAAIMASGISLCAAAENDALPFLVATDLHYKPMPQKVPNNFPGDKYYCSAGYSPSLLSESYAVLQAFLRQAAASDAEFILLCGDLTDEGTMRQHQEMAAYLSAFEQQTGKSVYVIDGNHDFFNRVSVQTFKDLYAELGYSEALEVDENTCSYTVDLSDKDRLLALDSCKPGYGEDGFTDELLQWADQQAARAKQDGKTLIAMMHHNFLEHFPFQSKIMPAFIVRPELDMKTHFLDWGVRYVFTGHTHAHDVTSYTDKANRTVYDIMTTSLNGYPCKYRSLSLNDSGLDMKTRRIERVDPADLTEGYTDELLEELSTDLDQYALGCFAHAFENKKDSFIGEQALSDVLKRFVGEKTAAFLDPFFRSFMQTLFLPIYEPDTPDGKCLADLSRSLGLTVPETDKKTVSDLVFYFVCVVYEGGENLPYYDPQIQLFMQCVYTSLFESMKTVNTQTREAILSDLRANFSGNAVPFAVSAAGELALGAVKDDRLLEVTLLMISPLIESFSKDDDVPDNDAFLPMQNTANPALSFLRQIWTRVYVFLQRYFSGFARIFKKYPLFSLNKPDYTY